MPYAQGDTKICSKCRVTKSLAEFPRNIAQKDGLGNQCHPCMRTSRAANYYRDPNASRASRLDSRRRRKYGITSEQFQTFGEAIGWRCPGDCKRRASVLDHSHVTNALRGMLCPQCNLALGYAADDPTVLRALADYLEEKPHAEYVEQINAFPSHRRPHYNSWKTHCPRGHAYEGENVRLYSRDDGSQVRYCLACEHLRSKERWATQHK